MGAFCFSFWMWEQRHLAVAKFNTLLKLKTWWICSWWNIICCVCIVDCVIHHCRHVLDNWKSTVRFYFWNPTLQKSENVFTNKIQVYKLVCRAFFIFDKNDFYVPINCLNCQSLLFMPKIYQRIKRTFYWSKIYWLTNSYTVHFFTFFIFVQNNFHGEVN